VPWCREAGPASSDVHPASKGPREPEVRTPSGLGTGTVIH
jgi:hypothetical protein